MTSASSGRVLRKIAAHAGCTLLIDAPRPKASDGPARSSPAAREGTPWPARHRGRGAAESAGPTTASSPTLCSLRAPSTRQLRRPPPSFQKDLRLISAVNVREEMSVHRGGSQSGRSARAAPDSIVVAFPSLDEYGSAGREIFTDPGIPLQPGARQQLATSPGGRRISLLLARRAGVLRSFAARSQLPFLKFAEQACPSPPALDGHAVTGGSRAERTGCCPRSSATPRNDRACRCGPAAELLSRSLRTSSSPSALLPEGHRRALPLDG